jgi:hypothetical protein
MTSGLMLGDGDPYGVAQHGVACPVQGWFAGSSEQQTDDRPHAIQDASEAVESCDGGDGDATTVGCGVEFHRVEPCGSKAFAVAWLAQDW